MRHAQQTMTCFTFDDCGIDVHPKEQIRFDSAAALPLDLHRFYLVTVEFDGFRILLQLNSTQSNFKSCLVSFRVELEIKFDTEFETTTY